MTLDDVSTLDETATYLRITPATLARLARAQKIGSIKQGRTRTFPRAAVEAYVVENTETVLPPNPHGLTDQALRRVRAVKP